MSRRPRVNNLIGEPVAVEALPTCYEVSICLVKKKTGPSIPFLDIKYGKCSLAYDAMKIEKTNGQISIIFMQEGVAIFAYTYDVDNEFVVNFDDMQGKVDINFMAS